MAATALADTRAAAATALAGITTAEIYRHRQRNYQYPCVVVGWPNEFDVRPVMGDSRDVTLSVFVGVEVFDDESADDALSALLEEVVDALQVNAAWDVLPVTDFGEQVLGDERVVIWATVPLRILT